MNRRHILSFYIRKEKWLRAFTIVALCFFVYFINAQNESFKSLPDSIKLKLQALNTEAQKVAYLLQIIEQIPVEQSNFIIVLVEECLKVAERNDLKVEAAKAAFWRIASTYEAQNYSVDNSLNIGELNKILYIFEQAKLPLWEARTKMVLSNTYYYLDEYSIALTTSEELIRLLRNLNSSNYPLLFGDAYKNRGNLFWGRSFDTTILNYEKAYHYYQHDSTRLRGKRILLNINLAIANLAKNNYEQSDAYCDQALVLCKPNDSISLAMVHLDCAHIISEQGLRRKDIKLFKTSNEKLKLAIDYGTSELSRSYYQLGANTQNIAIYSKDLDNITYQNLFKDAANYYLKAIISGTEEGHMDVYEDVFDAAVHLMGVEIEEDGVVSGGKV
ncbi:MAG: hypothetical protein AAGG68_29915, partial [Bacteroidota bacterium]